jgi:F-type H+-transporting ATPase subunit epsilon
MFKLYFATPEKKVVSDADLEEIRVPAFSGELDILPGHAPLMTTLDAGILRYRLKDSPQEHKLAISWGYCQVSSDGVTVLVEEAAHGDELDLKVIEQHLQENENRLASESLDDFEWEKVQHEIARLRAEVNLLNEKNQH